MKPGNNIHHEPPIFELTNKADENLAGTPMSGIRHAVIHKVRCSLFGKVEDQQAFDGQMSQLDRDGRKKVRKLLNSETMVSQVSDFIMERRKIFSNEE